MLAPADDLNYNKQKIGKKFNSYLEYCRRLVKRGKGDKLVINKTGYFLSAKRFLSQNDPQSIEGNILNYQKRKMKWIRGLPNIPIMIILGENDRFFIKPLEFYIHKLLKEIKVHRFRIIVMKNVGHSFDGNWKKIFEEITTYLVNEKRRIIHKKNCNLVFLPSYG